MTGFRILWIFGVVFALCHVLYSPTTFAQFNTQNAAQQLNAFSPFDNTAFFRLYGNALSPMGDFDGDGIQDYLTTEQEGMNNNLPALAYVQSGINGSILNLVAQQSPGDGFGWAAAGGGDINNDGTPDFVVTAPSTPSIGVAYIYPSNQSPIALSGPTGSNFFGLSVHLGDFNGDGFSDPAIHDFFGFTIYSGAGVTSTSAPHLPPIASITNSSFLSTGDINQDGYDDILAASNVGMKLFYGSSANPPIAASVSSLLNQISFGGNIINDLNGDNCPELATWSFTQIQLYRGCIDIIGPATSLPTPWLTFPQISYSNKSIASGDVDTDGTPEIFISNSGSVAIYKLNLSNPNLPTVNLWFTFTTSNSGDGFGNNVVYLGDTNGDGFGDLAISAAYTSPGGVWSQGAVYTYRLGGVKSVPPTLSNPLQLTWTYGLNTYGTLSLVSSPAYAGSQVLIGAQPGGPGSPLSLASGTAVVFPWSPGFISTNVTLDANGGFSMPLDLVFFQPFLQLTAQAAILPSSTNPTGQLSNALDILGF